MATTNIGSMKDKRIDRIRDAIYDKMMEGLMNKNVESSVFLDREVLFYTVYNLGLSKNQASYIASKIYNEGKCVTSRGLKEDFAGTSNELAQKQFTKFINKYMNSSRIELTSTTPYIWRMNGYSNFENPYISGYKRQKTQTENLLKKSEVTIEELLNPNNRNKDYKNKNVIRAEIIKINKLLYSNVVSKNIKMRNDLIDRRTILEEELFK